MADPRCEHVLHIQRVNAVMHVHQWKNLGEARRPRATPVRDMLVGCVTPTQKQTAFVSHLANKKAGSSFDQFSVNANPKPNTAVCRVDGAILQFSTDNFIRAGGDDQQRTLRAGGTHASALLSSLRYNRMTAKLCYSPLGWIGAAGTACLTKCNKRVALFALARAKQCVL